jgi:hypothetical protein
MYARTHFPLPPTRLIRSAFLELYNRSKNDGDRLGAFVNDVMVSRMHFGIETKISLITCVMYPLVAAHKIGNLVNYMRTVKEADRAAISLTDIRAGMRAATRRGQGACFADFVYNAGKELIKSMRIGGLKHQQPPPPPTMATPAASQQWQIMSSDVAAARSVLTQRAREQGRQIGRMDFWGNTDIPVANGVFSPSSASTPLGVVVTSTYYTNKEEMIVNAFREIPQKYSTKCKKGAKRNKRVAYWVSTGRLLRKCVLLLHHPNPEEIRRRLICFVCGKKCRGCVTCTLCGETVCRDDFEEFHLREDFDDNADEGDEELAEDEDEEGDI